MTIYEAWEDPDDNSILLATPDEIADHRAKKFLGPNAELLYRFEAATWEEAKAIHALRTGWEPYRPMGVHRRRARSAVPPTTRQAAHSAGAAARASKRHFALVSSRRDR